MAAQKQSSFSSNWHELNMKMLFGVSLWVCVKNFFWNTTTQNKHIMDSHTYSLQRGKMVNKYKQKLGNICREKSRKKIICTNVLNIVFGFFIAGKSRIAFVLEYLSALCYIFSLCHFLLVFVPILFPFIIFVINTH